MRQRYNAKKKGFAAAQIAGLLLLTGLAGGCDVILEEDYCAGYPEVVYTIGDVELIADVELYVRDLEARPRVFDHTYGDHLYYEVSSSNRRVARAYIDDGILTVEARNPGVAHIRIDAIDGCDDYTSTSFYVEVYAFGAAGKRKK